MPTTGFTPIRRRSTDIDPAANADHAGPKVGSSWQQPARPGAYFNNTEPAAWEPDEAPPLTVEMEDPETTKRVFWLTAAIIACALTIAVTFVVLSILEAYR